MATTTTATTRTVTLSNDFHGTEVTLRLRARDDGRYSVTRSQARRAWRELCGHDGCTCGDTFGARGGITLYPQAETRDGYIVDVVED